MAVIPIHIARVQPLETGSVVHYPTDSPVGRALEGAGRTLVSVASKFQDQQDAIAEKARQDQEQLDNFKETRAAALLPELLSGDLQSAQQNMSGDGTGTHDSLAGQFDPIANTVTKPGLFDERAAAIRNTLPESVRQKFDERLPAIREKFSRDAAATEFEQRSRFYDSEIKSGLEKLALGAMQADTGDPATFELFLKQGEDLINASGLPDYDKGFGSATVRGKHRRLQEWRETASETLFEAIKARDPAEAKRIADAWFGVGQAQTTAEGAVPSSSLTERIIQVESGGNPNAKADTSSATGLGQFIKSTWTQFLSERHPDLIGAGQDFRRDPELSREAVQWYAEKNQAHLRERGLPVTAGSTYLAHFLGPAGAADMLSASQMQTAASVNPAAASANKSIFYHKDGRAKSVAQVVAWAERKMGNAPPSIGAATAAQTVVAEEDPRFRYLPADRRIILARSAKTTADAVAASEKVEVSSLVDDDLASMEEAGVGVEDLTPERVAAALGEQRALEWVGKRQAAASRFAAMDGMEEQPSEALSARLSELQPVPGMPGYDKALDTYEAAEKRAADIQEKRFKDPAESVATLPEVVAAREAFDGRTPETSMASWQQLLRARISAQDRIGIAPGLRLPLTDAEADEFAAPIKNAAMLGDAAPGQSWFEMVEDMSKAFKAAGEYSDEVFRQVVGKLIGGEDKDDKARHAANLIKALLADQAAPFADARAIDELDETARIEDTAKQLSGGTPARGSGLRRGDPAPLAGARKSAPIRQPAGRRIKPYGEPKPQQPADQGVTMLGGKVELRSRVNVDIRPVIRLPTPDEEDIQFLRDNPETIWDFIAIFGDAEIPPDVRRGRR